MVTRKIEPGEVFGELTILKELPRILSGDTLKRLFLVECPHKRTHKCITQKLLECPRCFCHLERPLPWFITTGLENKLVTVKQAQLFWGISEEEAKSVFSKNKKKRKNESSKKIQRSRKNKTKKI